MAVMGLQQTTEATSQKMFAAPYKRSLCDSNQRLRRNNSKFKGVQTAFSEDILGQFIHPAPHKGLLVLLNEETAG